MEYMNMAVTLSPELERKMKLKLKQKYASKEKDLSASDNSNEAGNQVKAFRDLLMRGID